MRRRVVITGVGAVTPLGAGASALHDGWEAGRSGIEDGKGLCQRRDGSVFPAEIRRSNLLRGGSTFAVCTIHDESAHWEAEEELARRAMQDALTGLANRTLLLDRLDNALLRARRSRGSVAVLYVDIDWFKETNDLYGHAVGDTVLKHVAAMLQRALDTDLAPR